MLPFPRPSHDSVVSTMAASAEVEVRVPAVAPSQGQIDQLVEKRLDIARIGLTELRRRLAAGQEADAAVILNKVDEDLRMLQHRLRREAAKAQPRAVAVRRSDIQGGPRLSR